MYNLNYENTGMQCKHFEHLQYFVFRLLLHLKIMWIIDAAFIWILQELLHLSSEKIDPELYVWSCIWRHRSTKEEVTDWNQSAVLFKSQKSCCLCQMFQSSPNQSALNKRNDWLFFFGRFVLILRCHYPESYLHIFILFLYHSFVII